MKTSKEYLVCCPPICTVQPPPRGWSIELSLSKHVQVTGVSDVTGAITKSSGLDVLGLRAFLAGGGKLVEFPDADPIPPDDLLK